MTPLSFIQFPLGEDKITGCSDKPAVHQAWVESAVFRVTNLGWARLYSHHPTTPGSPAELILPSTFHYFDAPLAWLQTLTSVSGDLRKVLSLLWIQIFIHPRAVWDFVCWICFEITHSVPCCECSWFNPKLSASVVEEVWKMNWSEAMIIHICGWMGII